MPEQQQPFNAGPTYTPSTPTATPLARGSGAFKIITAIIIVAILGFGGYYAYAYFNPTPEKMVDRLIDQVISAASGKGAGYTSAESTFNVDVTVVPVADSTLADEVKSVTDGLQLSAPVTRASLLLTGAFKMLNVENQPGPTEGSATFSLMLDKAYKLLTIAAAVDSATYPKHIYLKVSTEDDLATILSEEDAQAIEMFEGLFGNQWIDFDLEKIAQIAGVDYNQIVNTNKKEEMKRLAPVLDFALHRLIDRGVVIFTPEGEKVEIAGHRTQPFIVTLDLTNLPTFVREDGPVIVDRYQAAFPERLTVEQAQAIKADLIKNAEAPGITDLVTVYNTYAKNVRATVFIEPRSGLALGTNLTGTIIIPNEGEVTLTVKTEITGLNTVTAIPMPANARPAEQIIGPLLGM